MALSLAGCASDEPTTSDPDAVVPGDQSALPSANVNGSAPTWSVGQWWDHKWFFGSTASEAFTVKTLVAEDFVPAAVGDWRVVTTGAGAFAAGGGIQAYAITQRAGTV